ERRNARRRLPGRRCLGQAAIPVPALSLRIWPAGPAAVVLSEPGGSSSAGSAAPAAPPRPVPLVPAEPGLLRRSAPLLSARLRLRLLTGSGACRTALRPDRGGEVVHVGV